MVPEHRPRPDKQVVMVLRPLIAARHGQNREHQIKPPNRSPRHTMRHLQVRTAGGSFGRDVLKATRQNRPRAARSGTSPSDEAGPVNIR